MQQPVNNRWLSPALRNLADNEAWTPDRQQALYRAGLEAREAIVLQTTDARRGRSDPGRHRVHVGGHLCADGAPAVRTLTTGTGLLRQVVLALAMTCLLLGSIAFSFLAWSGTPAPAPLGPAEAAQGENRAFVDPRTETTTKLQNTPGAQDAKDTRGADLSRGQRVRMLRQENGRLHERASALRSALH